MVLIEWMFRTIDACSAECVKNDPCVALKLQLKKNVFIDIFYFSRTFKYMVDIQPLSNYI